ncbi:nitrate/nitrite transporter NrtS [Alphaproteobacteria bacterium]|jgi:hypothetical protein|nr:nitrate/nitrite transporter NrtS [Alphaproteobacteria bacterium]
MSDINFALSVFFSKKVAKRSAVVAIIVGVILAFINHGDSIINASLTPTCWLKMIASCIVPFTVSSVTAVLAAIEARNSVQS